MLRYIGKRLALMIPVLIAVTLLLFIIQAVAPGDPAVMALGQDASETEKYEWKEERGLNAPLAVQYFNYMKNLVCGDFGNSYSDGRPITQSIVSRWPTTIIYATVSLLIASVIGIVLGVLSAVKRGKFFDSVMRVISIVMFSMPNFWFALLLIIVFALDLKWFPVSGFYGPKYWVLPIVALMITNSAGILRFTRSSMLDNLQADYVRSARAKGQTEFKVIMHHVFNNSLIPIVTYVGSCLASAFGGVIVLEQVFSIPGLGTLLITAINHRDWPLLRGCVILIAVTTAVMNLLIDLIYAFLDPRVKARFKNDAARKGKKALKIAS
jgi:peptide/nickel transport system permease protein